MTTPRAPTRIAIFDRARLSEASRALTRDAKAQPPSPASVLEFLVMAHALPAMLDAWPDDGNHIAFADMHVEGVAAFGHYTLNTQVTGEQVVVEFSREGATPLSVTARVVRPQRESDVTLRRFSLSQRTRGA